MKPLNEFFKALGDPTRRQIIQLLRERDLTPTEILEKIAVSQPTLSHHLDILKRAGLVDSEREGQFIRYSINMSIFETALEYMTKFTGKKR
ncbi:MAG: autorepressor SdpR family transcription factor [candidate division Zixibacteria bacterium]|jgi:DNA-binding transcriptional ArsR family regulator|nr:autorepressor SdpR family transcription factor [candidate division Zixibacteria bacterium]